MKRWNLHILVSLVLGVVTTVAVAWGLAWLNRPADYTEVQGAGRAKLDSGEWYLRAYEEPGMRYMWAFIPRFAESNTEALDRETFGEIPPLFLRISNSLADRMHCRTGWPALAMSWDAIERNRHESVVEHGIKLPTPEALEDNIMVASELAIIALPLQPEWPGFAIDVAFYSALWVPLLLLRRRLCTSDRGIGRRGVVFGLASIIALGAAVNVAVAWLCAVMVDVHYDHYGEGDAFGEDGYPDSFGRWWLFRSQETGAIRLSSSLFLGGGIGGGGPDADSFDICPGWADFARPPARWLERESDGDYIFAAVDLPHEQRTAQYDEMKTWGGRVVDARGWPMLSMWSGMRMRAVRPKGRNAVESEPDEVVHGVLFEHRDEHGYIDERRSTLIPLMPIWSGFIINSAFYAGLLGICLFALIGPRPFIRRWRTGRGRCPRCGYDLRYHHAPCGAEGQPSHAERGATKPNTGCPEGGWNRA